MKSSTSVRSCVTVIEPTLMSQRLCQLPAVIASHFGVSHSTVTPRRFAISVATSMSKPSYSPVSAFNDDWGGYAGSVETLIAPCSQMLASRSPVVVFSAQTPLPADPVVPPVDPPSPPPSSPPPQAAAISASTPTIATKPRVRNFRIRSSFRGARRTLRAPLPLVRGRL